MIKVIILSVNPRSGSTYISEVLSSAPMTSLWSEPLRFLYEKPPKEEPRRRKFFNSQLKTKKQAEKKNKKAERKLMQDEKKKKATF